MTKNLQQKHRPNRAMQTETPEDQSNLTNEQQSANQAITTPVIVCCLLSVIVVVDSSN